MFLNPIFNNFQGFKNKKYPLKVKLSIFTLSLKCTNKASEIPSYIPLIIRVINTKWMLSCDKYSQTCQ